MKTPILILIGLSSCLFAVPVYIGTNTGGNTGSKGIYQADFDPETGKLSGTKLAAEYRNPGFLVQHPTKPILYACGQPNKAFEDGTDAVAAFTIGADHSLAFLGESTSGGRGVCHLAIDRGGKTIALANYGDGNISSVRLRDDGSPGELVSLVKHSGSGPNKKRQERPHAHGVYFDSEMKRLFVPDLGLDKVFVFPFDESTSKLGGELPPLATAPGAGPRHMAFSPDEKHAYVINELDCTILVASHDDGAFQLIETVKTLPDGFEGANTTAEIEVSADGRFVYGSNRGHDSIVVFARDAQSGKLALVQHAPCGGKTPRHFKISPDGKWLLCGHQGSNTISVLPRDPASGKLGEAKQTVSSPSPICILFAR
jgi:6-phosphogluconolactonase